MQVGIAVLDEKVGTQCRFKSPTLDPRNRKEPRPKKDKETEEETERGRGTEKP